MDGVSPRGGGGTPVAQKKHQMFGKRVFQDQGDLPGSPAGVATGSPAKFDYGGGATAGQLYSHSSVPLDGASGMSSMEMKYGCGMDYNPHPHGTCTFSIQRSTELKLNRRAKEWKEYEMLPLDGIGRFTLGLIEKVHARCLAGLSPSSIL